LQTAQSESEPHRQAQYARAACDSAAEVATDIAARSADRERAVAVMHDSHTLAAQSMLREAESTLAEARDSADPQRRRELARSAVSKARHVARHREISEDERSAARQIVGHGRLLAKPVSAAGRRQERAELEQEHPGLAL
jgi:hypothetical protein